MKKRNKLASLLLGLVFAISTVAVGCKSGGSTEIEDACEDFCEYINDCAGIPEVQKFCEEDCEDDFEKADEFDGDDCVESQLVLLDCEVGLTCSEVLEFQDLRLRDATLDNLRAGDLLCMSGMPLDCCEAELIDVVDVKCPETIVIIP